MGRNFSQHLEVKREGPEGLLDMVSTYLKEVEGLETGLRISPKLGQALGLSDSDWDLNIVKQTRVGKRTLL